ncbi:DUF3558 family protein [Rhodococcus sp. BGS-1C]|uniref:DUF3558 family protein n=1 Tax=unclassified Rhodococcus (in: high G+C Gram-positive bacteria) TaxID=192944 RepID=UPI000969C8C5|nr:DUF3558 family protein [Rhodococcus sp. KRD197]OLT33140.1 hypothetical protein BJF84_23805 [Rhodococcus sp. CUA-806]
MRKALAMVVAGVVLVVGCGGDVKGTALAGERWDPCSIPDEAIEATGLDPTYRDVGWGEGIVVDDWARCVFRAPKDRQSYSLSVMSSSEHTVSDARGDERKLNQVDFELADRDALQYETDTSRAVVDCHVVVAVPTGVVWFIVMFAGGIKPERDPCDLVRDHAADLEHLLPPLSR